MRDVVPEQAHGLAPTPGVPMRGGPDASAERAALATELRAQGMTRAAAYVTFGAQREGFADSALAGDDQAEAAQ